MPPRRGPSLEVILAGRPPKGMPEDDMEDMEDMEDGSDMTADEAARAVWAAIKDDDEEAFVVAIQDLVTCCMGEADDME